MMLSFQRIDGLIWVCSSKGLPDLYADQLSTAVLLLASFVPVRRPNRAYEATRLSQSGFATSQGSPSRLSVVICIEWPRILRMAIFASDEHPVSDDLERDASLGLP